VWQFRPLCAILPVLALGCGVAVADELDGWCAQVSKASSVVICSDLELRQQAIDRNKLFEAARQKLSPTEYKVLSADQTLWIKSYTARCGVSVDDPVPSQPILQSVIECYRRESHTRTAQLATRLSEPMPTPPVPAATFVPKPDSPPIRAPAKATTGYDLYLACSSENSNSGQFLRCLNLLHGLWDGAMTMQIYGKQHLFCPKTSVQVGQMALIFDDWARRHPADLGHDASDVVIASFIDSFPCPAARSQAGGDPPSKELSPADMLLK
jgi:uncharacterized protein YecT (DUF1311 family)